jgi:hypothetical protein
VNELPEQELAGLRRARSKPAHVYQATRCHYEADKMRQQHNIIPIPETLSVIADCWAEAENALRTAIDAKYFDLDEEVITVLFSRELEYSFNGLNNTAKLESAIQDDLREALGLRTLDRDLQLDIDEWTNGIIAEVEWHTKQREGKTGGDFGLVINHPEILMDQDQDEITQESGRQGLLCQAKRFRNNSRPRFTRCQKNILPDRLQYLSLVIYRYVDDKGRQLEPFQWHPCNCSSLEEIRTWMSQDRFPEPKDSSEIIKALGSGQLGTSDPGELEHIVNSTATPVLQVCIKWKDNTPRCKYERALHKPPTSRFFKADSIRPQCILAALVAGRRHA